MADTFASFGDAPIAPARHLAAVTPSDDDDLAAIPKALWIAVAGTLSVMAVGDDAAVALGELPAGTLVPVRARRVMATGTTATVVALG